VHLILANPPWRQLQERAEKIPGDKKHVEGMLSQSHCVAQFNTAHERAPFYNALVRHMDGIRVRRHPLNWGSTESTTAWTVGGVDEFPP
jgi:hypothetical protein